VTLNCGAVPPSLLESELFGHVKGAFTGALRDRPGLFEVAGAGTLLLDEVGDMPAEMQVKLLRILQEGSFRRLGEERERTSHCRVLSASHRRLAELVAEGRFREDLFYRLNVIELEVPPLRERREDIPLLVEHILASAKKQVTVAPRALAALLDHGWPGNVRQLENELQRAILLCDSVIEPEHLTIPAALRTRRARGGPAKLEGALRDHERDLIRAALDEADGNVTLAAGRLGLHRVALHRKMRRLGIGRGRE
jgi:DNA-binding NtrC family response regulator